MAFRVWKRMAVEIFRFRTDLTVAQQQTQETPVFVVKDPLTGRFFRLKEPEYFIARQLDGATSLEAIRHRVEEKYGAALSQEALKQFVERLSRLGLLAAGGVEARRNAAHGRVGGSLLYLRFKAFDPDRLLNRMKPRVRFFFTAYFLAFSAFAILCGLAITLLNGDQIARDFYSLWRFHVLVPAWFTVLFVTLLHEFAHGLACKHFGGEVHEMGFMLIYFQPAFYCNVSDAWLFPERSKRLWVTFAGAYFEIFLWALATFAWRLVEPGTWVSFVALVVMATSGIKTLFNLNPLIKLDGYYLLSDYLEIPNLRQRAFAYLRARIRKIRGSAVEDPVEVTARDRRVYLMYGLLAGIYSSWLLGYVLLAFGGYLIGRYQGLGLILFGGLLMLIFRNPLRRLLARTGTPWKMLPGRMGLMKRRLGVLGASAVLLAFIFLGRMELRVSGDFRVLPLHNADVRAEVEGIIEEIYVDEGDRVQRGDLIARLIDRDHRAELRKTDAEIDEKRAKLKMLKAGPRPEEIDVAKAAVAKFEEQLKYARSSLSRSQAAFERQLISRKELEEAEAQVAVREKEREEAQKKLKVLLAGSREEEIEATEAEIDRLKAHKRYFEKQLELLKVVSPISGVVTTPSLKLKEKIGQYVKKGDLISEVHELRTITAEIAVAEKDIADVRAGEKVVVKVRAYPQERFEGKVASIATTATAKNQGDSEGELWGADKVVMVTTQLDNRSLLLKPGMTGHAKIDCGERRIFDLVTGRLAKYIRVEFWSWW